ncbi:MAG: prepilin peptidase [Eubacteriales bacterium]|nr:prepilin peptidase [Eubacteriales bacterium]
MRNLLCGVYLSICAVQDLRTRKISVLLSMAAGVTALTLDAFVLYRRPADVLPYLAGLIPGALLLLLAFAADGAAGAGDGICFLILGAFLGARRTWILLVCALLAAAVGGGIFLALGKAGKKTKLPFLAFAAMAWAIQAAADLAPIHW